MNAVIYLVDGIYYPFLLIGKSKNPKLFITLLTKRTSVSMLYISDI